MIGQIIILNNYALSQEIPNEFFSNKIKSTFIKSNLEWWLKPESSILASLELVNYYKSSNELNFNFGVNVFFPKNFLFY